MYKYPFVILFLFISCHPNNRKHKDGSSSKQSNVAGNFSNQKKLKFDVEKMATFFTTYSQLNAVKNEVDSFYHSREYAFAWFDDKGLIEQASNLYNQIQNASTEGINDKFPYQNELSSMLNERDSNNLNVNTEIMLTAQYFEYAKKVWAGLDAEETEKLDWFVPRKKISYPLLLDSFINGKDVLSNPPIYRQYSLLKNQLKKYFDIQKSGGFPGIDAVKTNLKKGDSAATVATIKKWLWIAGDLPESSSSAAFDDTLEVAVKKIQRRFGLQIDGMITPSLIKEMNVPIAARLQQIIVNMERSRWIPISVSNDYLVVNIP